MYIHEIVKLVNVTGRLLSEPPPQRECHSQGLVWWSMRKSCHHRLFCAPTTKSSPRNEQYGVTTM